jgi:hypothetical protein
MEKLETIYFPACGFGFWYLLGKYEHIRKNQSDYILTGSSAGSLICLCSLVDFGDDENFAGKIIKVALETLDEYKNQTHLLNYYILQSIFISKMFKHINETSDKTQQQLKRIRIQTTQFHPPFWFEKRQTTPTSLAHLKELCLASCYIPFISNYDNRLTYLSNGEHHIDGSFIDMYIPNTESFIVPHYNLFELPSEEKAQNMRDSAYNEPFSINRTSDGRVLIFSMSLLIGCMQSLFGFTPFKLFTI